MLCPSSGTLWVSWHFLTRVRGGRVGCHPKPGLLTFSGLSFGAALVGALGYTPMDFVLPIFMFMTVRPQP